jgi:hypothetical protein
MPSLLILDRVRFPAVIMEKVELSTQVAEQHPAETERPESSEPDNEKPAVEKPEALKSSIENKDEPVAQLHAKTFLTVFAVCLIYFAQVINIVGGGAVS